MVRHTILNLFLLAIFLGAISCSAPTVVQPWKKQEPLQQNFLYYDPDFELDPNTQLRTDGLYFFLKEEDLFGDTHFIFRFYPDGVVVEYNVYNSPEKVVQLERKLDGNLHGYYKVQGDSILFSTAIYYDHSQNFYIGQIFQDSIIIREDRFNEFPGEPTTYYFFGNE